MSDWVIRTREHTFSTGRQAVLRQSLPVTVVIDRALERGITDIVSSLGQVAEGTLADPEKGWAIACLLTQAMFVEPRLYLPGEVPEEDWVPIEALEDEERTETLEIALAEVAGTARFRGDGGGDGDGEGGEGVADPPKPARGSGARNRKRVPA